MTKTVVEVGRTLLALSALAGASCVIHTSKVDGGVFACTATGDCASGYVCVMYDQTAGARCEPACAVEDVACTIRGDSRPGICAFVADLAGNAERACVLCQQSCREIGEGQGGAECLARHGTAVAYVYAASCTHACTTNVGCTDLSQPKCDGGVCVDPCAGACDPSRVCHYDVANGTTTCLHPAWYVPAATSGAAGDSVGATAVAIALDGAGPPAVAWTSATEWVTVRRIDDNGDWSDVGSPGPTSDCADAGCIAFDPALTYAVGDSGLRVAWSQLAITGERHVYWAQESVDGWVAEGVAGTSPHGSSTGLGVDDGLGGSHPAVLSTTDGAVLVFQSVEGSGTGVRGLYLPAGASAWRPLGMHAQISGYVSEGVNVPGGAETLPTVAADAGNLFVAWQAHAGAIYVRSLAGLSEGGEWTSGTAALPPGSDMQDGVPGALAMGAGYRPALVAAHGSPLLAWRGLEGGSNTQGIYVATATSDAWSGLAGQSPRVFANGEGDATHVSIGYLGDFDRPVVAFVFQGRILVLQYLAADGAWAGLDDSDTVGITRGPEEEAGYGPTLAVYGQGANSKICVAWIATSSTSVWVRCHDVSE